ncbi:conserved protein, unknown function [Hepatocystis sp. ex Piliocolobus tephrosceles]|nr:conserved protein, unknown function [Hepatocystis sp. ex Piliocolobus tephrosceles]
MNTYKEHLKTKFEYKYLLYSVSFVLVNLGICNEYIKRKHSIHSNEKPKIYFNLSDKNFEYVNKTSYFKRLNKICNSLNVPLEEISKAAKNYYPIEYHLQYLNNIFENTKKKLENIIKNEKNKTKDMNEILEKLIDEIINDFESHWYNGHESKNEKYPFFLEQLDWKHLKEFILERKKISLYNSVNLITTLIDELYAYIYIYLIINYKRNNMFNFFKIKRMYRHCSENVGKDIGLEVNNYLWLNSDDINYTNNFACINNKNNGSMINTNDEGLVNNTKYILNIDTLNEIKESLSKYGVVVLQNLIPIEDIEKIKKHLYIDKTDINIAQYLMAEDQNIFCIRPTRGRQYCILRNSRKSDSFVNIQQKWLNIIYNYLPIGKIHINMFDFFSSKNIDKNNMFNFNWENINNLNVKVEENDKIYISDLQLINNEPLSEIQSYHVDNGLGGISVMLPLNKINEQSGNFEFFLGTHKFSSFKKKLLKEKLFNLNKFMEIYYQTRSSFIPKVKEKDVIIYDSKIIHRGLSNHLWLKNSALIYRYDYKNYPPPGQDFLDIVSYNVIGKCISFFNFLGKYF